MSKDLITTDFVELTLTEAKGKPGVLGIVEGPHFFPNVPSRNNRTYPNEAWVNALGNDGTRRILESNLMIGTVGHAEMDFDTLIREEKLSHRTTKLWIGEDGIGQGRAEILDTPVGRCLHTLIRSGSKMAVSSKGTGEYRGKDDKGVQEVDPKTFKLERFDFVVDPGFLDAQPSLKEALEEAANSSLDEDKYILDNKETKKIQSHVKEDDNMSKEMLETLMAEKLKAEDVISTITEENTTLTAKVAVLEDTKSELAEAKIVLGKLKDQMGAMEKFFSVHGDVQKASDLIEKLQSDLKEYGTFGTVEELATLKEKQEAIDTMFEELGDETKIKAALEESQKFIAEVNEIGTVAEIKEALEMASTYIDEQKTAQIKESTEKLSATYGVSTDVVAKLIETSGGVESAEVMLKELKEDTGYTTGDTDEDLDEDGKKKIKKKSIMDQNLSERLLRQF